MNIFSMFMSPHDAASTSFDSSKAATSDLMTESSATSTSNVENRPFANGSNQKLNIAISKVSAEEDTERLRKMTIIKLHSPNADRSATNQPLTHIYTFSIGEVGSTPCCQRETPRNIWITYHIMQISFSEIAIESNANNT